MKRATLILLLLIIAICIETMASTPQKAVEFFKQYENLANTYDEKLIEMYSPNVKIIREVVKPTGETEDVIVPTKRFFKELKIGQKTAKLRRYKNRYRNITATQTPEGIKISAERQPSKETYWLKMYQIVQNTNTWFKIKEEMMQTKVQSFLKHKDEGE